MNTTTATTAQVLADNYRSLKAQLAAARQAESDLGERDEMLYRDQYALAAQMKTIEVVTVQLGLADEVGYLLTK